jgi:dimethylhistidine N-methyltransferase
MRSCLDIASDVEVLEFSVPRHTIREEVLSGLKRPSKSLPSKLFYDDHGSQLFEQICRQPEYYPTRTEQQIMSDNGRQIARTLGKRVLVVEYGSGSSAKTRTLLNHLEEPAGYIPIDISRMLLHNTSRNLRALYPHVPIGPVVADYTRPFRLPPILDLKPSRIVAYFPGSTIGNFEPEQALSFLKAIRATCGDESSLLIGVDLKKDPVLLHGAYNDAAGVTEAFNLNILRRLNREIGSDFQVQAFRHYAFYNPSASRVEMHLVSRERQSVRIDDALIEFEEGESIRTEDCHKFTLRGFGDLASKVGYKLCAIWTDPQKWFSVQYFTGALANTKSTSREEWNEGN